MVMEIINAYFDHAAEASVIGAALQDERCMKLAVRINPDEFHDLRNQTILLAIIALEKAGKAIDLVTMYDYLRTQGKLEAAGGDMYLTDCVTQNPYTANIQSHIAIVHEKAMRRQLYKIGKDLMEKSGSTDDPEETREWAARTVREVKLGDGVKLIPLQDALIDTYSAIEKEQEQEDKPLQRILSGIANLDNKLGGLRGGEYVAIGARPSVGKSILALTFCKSAAKAGKKVLLISLEMSAQQITERLIASEGTTTMGEITSGQISMDGWMGMSKVLGPLGTLPIWYCLEASTVSKVRRAAYQLYEKEGLDMIAVDYLQLMEAEFAKRQNRQEQIAEISRGLRLLAQELKIPILVLTQLNRASEKQQINGKRVRREPTMSEARESGAIEQDANIFILLHDPKKDEMEDDLERQTWDNLKKQNLAMMRIIIDKNRQGKRGRVTVAFDGDHMRFLPIVRKESYGQAY